MTYHQPGLVQYSRGEYSVRLAANPTDIAVAQRLRYHVFYEELQARADAAMQANRQDADHFDPICDHLLVVRSGSAPGDRFRIDDGELVGTYRLLRQEVAELHGGFYTQREFDIAALIARKPGLHFLELGRSCVVETHRTKPVIELLWQGIWDYARAQHIDVMFGCASLEGADARRHGQTLQFLASHFAAPEDWHVAALPTVKAGMTDTSAGAPDLKAAMKALPPLIKGYLRLGCYIGDGAVIDHQFNTTDVLIVLPVANINPRYFAHFGAPAEAVNG